MSALDSLPHGPEFRFVDSLERLEPGKSAAAVYQVRGDEPFLAGHFPGNPVMPGVILVEAIAQLGGVVAQSDLDVAPIRRLLLTGIRGAKILGSAKPGDTLRVSATVEGRLGGMIQVGGEVRVADEVLATAKVMLSGEE